jgi:DNA-binding NtrC family response regulator
VSLKILVLDPDAPTRRAWAKALIAGGFEVLTAEDPTSAASLVRTSRPDVLVIELSAFERERDAFVASGRPIIVSVSAERLAEGEPAVDPAQAIVTRALGPPAGLARLARALVRGDAPKNAPMADEIDAFVAVASASRAAEGAARGAAEGAAPVLFIGEPGVGKRTLARLVHRGGSRRRAPLVEVACSTLAPGRASDELFGADGALARAADGVLLLDRVDALDAPAQTALAAVLGDRARRARVVATAAPSIRDAMKSGAFSADLFFPLAAVLVDVVPLRARRDDIPVLAHVFARRAATMLGKPPPRLGTDVLRRLRGSDWPGNVPELEACVVRAVSMSAGDGLAVGDLGALPGEPEPVPADLRPYVEARGQALHAFERDYVESLLGHTGENLTRAAALAGMDRANFRRLVRRVRGLPRPGVRTKPTKR